MTYVKNLFKALTRKGEVITLYPLRCAAELGTHRNSGFTNEGQKNSLFKCSPRHIAGREHGLMRFKYSDCKALHVTVVGQPMGKQHLPQHCASLLSPGPQPAGSIRRGGGSQIVQLQMCSASSLQLFTRKTRSPRRHGDRISSSDGPSGRQQPLAAAMPRPGPVPAPRCLTGAEPQCSAGPGRARSAKERGSDGHKGLGLGFGSHKCMGKADRGKFGGTQKPRQMPRVWAKEAGGSY